VYAGVERMFYDDDDDDNDDDEDDDECNCCVDIDILKSKMCLRVLSLL